MPTGAGVSPGGTSIGGFGALDTAPAPATKILIDPFNGAQQNARKIDSRLRQFTFNAQGRIAGMPGVYQRVQIAIQTVRGQSSLGPGFGNAVSSVTVKVGNYQRRIEDALRFALNDLITQKLITINAVQAFDAAPDNTDGAYAILFWTDLTTGTEQKTRV